MKKRLNHPIPETFLEFLRAEFVRRCRKNPGYSLRSYSRALQINPASLSRILRAQRPVSLEMRDRLGARLGLGPTELGLYSVDQKTGVTTSETLAPAYRALPADAFAAIADWYHYAILEVIHLDDFKPEARWVAKKLGVSVTEIQVAIERLCRMGLLVISGEGNKWVAPNVHHTNDNADLKVAAFRKLQRQILEQAIQALDEVPIEYRDQSSMTMSIDTALLPEAIEKVTAFRREICAFLQSSQKRDSVYQMSISLFPVNPVVKSMRSKK